jgi:hypothetical protein
MRLVESTSAQATGFDRRDQAAIELYSGQGQVLQGRQRRIPCAEIVQRDRNVMGAQMP